MILIGRKKTDKDCGERDQDDSSNGPIGSVVVDEDDLFTSTEQLTRDDIERVEETNQQADDSMITVESDEEAPEESPILKKSMGDADKDSDVEIIEDNNVQEIKKDNKKQTKAQNSNGIENGFDDYDEDEDEDYDYENEDSNHSKSQLFSSDEESDITPNHEPHVQLTADEITADLLKYVEMCSEKCGEALDDCSEAVLTSGETSDEDEEDHGYGFTTDLDLKTYDWNEEDEDADGDYHPSLPQDKYLDDSKEAVYSEGETSDEDTEDHGYVGHSSNVDLQNVDWDEDEDQDHPDEDYLPALPGDKILDDSQEAVYSNGETSDEDQEEHGFVRDDVNLGNYDWDEDSEEENADYDYLPALPNEHLLVDSQDAVYSDGETSDEDEVDHGILIDDNISLSALNNDIWDDDSDGSDFEYLPELSNIKVIKELDAESEVSMSSDLSSEEDHFDNVKKMYNQALNKVVEGDDETDDSDYVPGDELQIDEDGIDSYDYHLSSKKRPWSVNEPEEIEESKEVNYKVLHKKQRTEGQLKRTLIAGTVGAATGAVATFFGLVFAGSE